ncbi:reverse transcriptase [Trichonephila clavipes]|nr:reverse transcriptase [Trichonephila clavipes]
MYVCFCIINSVSILSEQASYIHKPATVTQKIKSLGKPWSLWVLYEKPGESRGCCTLLPITTGHNFMEVYLHWLDLAADEACPLCCRVRMNSSPLLQCTGLDKYSIDDVVSRYWEARCQKFKKPSTGVV